MNNKNNKNNNNNKNNKNIFFNLILILFLIYPCNILQAENNKNNSDVTNIKKIKSIRIWPSPGSVRVVFDLSHAIEYKIQTLSGPHRIVVDFEDAQIVTKISDDLLQSKQITKIRHGVHDNRTRIVFEVSGVVKPNSFVLTPNDHYGHRLVLDLESSEKQEILALFDLDELQEPLEVKTEIKTEVKTDANKELNKKLNKVIKKSQRNFIIAIDAGHGGEDPGAIGPRGTREKNVVLAIAKELQEIINQQKGMRAFLTRKGDYYVGLRDRMRRARKHSADLFISIHADAAYKNKNADGASVFVLSARGASSEAAKWLAESENRSDLVGGVSLDDKGDVLASVLLDLSQTANARSSLDAAKFILDSLGRDVSLHKNYVEQAGFAVLKAPDVPSILVETGFISNPKTEKKLKDRNYQRILAKDVMRGIEQYFKVNKINDKNY